MIPGISTACLYPQYTEIALAQILAQPVAAVEVFINCAQELSRRALTQMRKLADANGTRILSVHPFTSGMEPILFFSAYQRRFDEGVEFYKKYYEACNILGADIVVFHGNKANAYLDEEEYIERFGKLVENAASFGVKLCHENVCRCAGRDPRFFTALAKSLPDAHFVLDVKQAVRSGQDVFSYIKAMGNRIAHVHISDHNSTADCLVPGKGTFNIAEFLLSIANLNPDCGIIVELYRQNFAEIVEIFAGYQHVLSHISTCAHNA